MAQYFADGQKRAAVDLYFECRNSSVVVSGFGHPPVAALLGRAKLGSRRDRPVRECRHRSFEEKMEGDVAEFQAVGREAYLSPLIDLFNGEVANHSASTSPTVAEKVPAWVGPVAHTDQGLQYWHRSYKQKVAETGGVQSMSRKANRRDNAPAESFFGHLKSESFYRGRFRSVEEFVSALDDCVRWCNNGRIRCDLNGMSPVEYRQYRQAMG